MYVVHGEIYTFTFEAETITIKSDIGGTDKITLDSYVDEDFSIFDLGPYVADDVKMLANSCTINGTTTNNVFLHVQQSAGNYIKLEIKTQPADVRTDPIDSGTRLHFMKDYVRTYN